MAKAMWRILLLWTEEGLKSSERSGRLDERRTAQVQLWYFFEDSEVDLPHQVVQNEKDCRQVRFDKLQGHVFLGICKQRACAESKPGLVRHHDGLKYGEHQRSQNRSNVKLPCGLWGKRKKKEKTRRSSLR